MKPGFKTSEFWLAVTGQLLSLLVLTGFIDIGAKDQASAQAMVNIGDPGVFMDSSMLMGDGLIVAGRWATAGGRPAARPAPAPACAAARCLRCVW